MDMRVKYKYVTILIIVFICLINLSRFLFLEVSPPGFYTDEAAGATQALCIAQSGYDFYGQFLPLFPRGFEGGGVFTPFYIYGEILWTKVFGPSIAAFRSFSAFICCLTILALYFFVKNSTNKQIALYVVFIASLMPWAFQFSRIAWDPPLATFFFISALAALYSQKKLWFVGILFAFAMYSYPPMRISVPFFLLAAPSLGIEKKLRIVGWIGVASIPLLLQYLDPNFISHAKDLAIWSNPSLNPYPKFNFLGLTPLFFENVASYFTGTFLFNRGDINLRNSIQSVGMLSLVDKIAFLSFPVSCLFFFGKGFISKNSSSFFIPNQWVLLKIAFLGIMANIIPAALTNEGNPHALRAIGAWPFFAVLSGLFLYRFGTLTNPRAVAAITICIGAVFLVPYLDRYLHEYPEIAKNAFRINNNSGIDYAYERIAKDGLSCEAAKNAPYQAVLDKPFTFGYNSKFLLNGWHSSEDWGAWSNSPSAYLSIPVPVGNPKFLIVTASVFLSQRFPIREVNILLNGKIVKRARFGDQGKIELVIPIPSSIKDGESLNIEFDVGPMTSPKAAGVSEDDRNLGMALYTGEFKSSVSSPNLF
jgi:4-amino-4-deoxy-L-arabinose transferase-like glycosyltransferase